MGSQLSRRMTARQSGLRRDCLPSKLSRPGRKLRPSELRHRLSSWSLRPRLHALGAAVRMPLSKTPFPCRHQRQPQRRSLFARLPAPRMRVIDAGVAGLLKRIGPAGQHDRSACSPRLCRARRGYGRTRTARNGTTRRHVGAFLSSSAWSMIVNSPSPSVEMEFNLQVRSR